MIKLPNTVPSHLIDASLRTGTAHLVGIGGIGMSGLAILMQTFGWRVQGSDDGQDGYTKILKNKDIRIYSTHRAQHISDKINLLIISSAINESNEEYQTAYAQNIPIISRATMLAHIIRYYQRSFCISGAHGKTTTTALMIHAFSQTNLDPTFAVGGILTSYKTNAYVGNNKDTIIVEADESDGSFLLMPSWCSVITNMTPEHLDYYQSFEKQKEAFLSFGCQAKHALIACIDDENVASILSAIDKNNIITYGFSKNAFIRLIKENIFIDKNGIYSNDIVVQIGKSKYNVRSSLLGRHNALNVLAVLATGYVAGILDCQNFLESFKTFKGIKRRFTHVGIWNGINIYDDYGHHPHEIQSVLTMARKICKGQIFAIIQPHRYTRVRDNFDGFIDSFKKADHVFVSDIYSAGEESIKGISGLALTQEACRQGQKDVVFLKNQHHLLSVIPSKARTGDMVIFFGAGDVTKWSYALFEQLNKIQSSASTPH